MIILIFLLSLNLSAIGAIDIERALKEKDKTTAFYINVQNLSTLIDHEETSIAGSYTSLDNENTISSTRFSVDFSQEFFHKELFSFNIMLRAGNESGEDKGEVRESDLIYTDVIDSDFYGSGISFNLNLVGFGIIIQPFVSVYQLTYAGNYSLSYKEDGGSDKITIDYTKKSLVMEYALGLRFLNRNAQVLSYLALSAQDELYSKLENESEINGTKITLDDESLSLIDPDKVFLTFGFGFLF